MATKPYLPATDEGLWRWAVNFDTQLQRQAAALGITPEEVSEYTSLRNDYADKLNKATTPETRGGASILAKNQVKQSLTTLSRKLAMAVTNNPKVTDQQRYDCGLTVREKGPTPVPPPSSSPVLDVVSVIGRVVKIRLHAAGTPSKRGKPTGVLGASVFSYVGDAPPEDVGAWTFVENTTKTVVDVQFSATATSGAKVWLTAFWYNRTAESGPACPPVSTYLQGGSVSQAA